MCNLGYMDNEHNQHSLVLVDITKEKGLICDHCNNSITGNVYHFKEYANGGLGGQWTDKQWAFDYKCMPFVIGAGLK